jgi:EAL domain-containing protein (putative c-di-GMP-specific phosphodiesterase class I)
MINDLINDKSIEIYLQPIVSIKGKTIFGYEALTRAYDRYGEAISPLYLFEQAKKEHLCAKLDEYVREQALIKFSDYYHRDKELLLFLKFESCVIEEEQRDEFIPLVYRYNISPTNIVIEIKEDKIRDGRVLKKFIDNYRGHDFLIALEDFGSINSSYDRLEFLTPDIVKIDRSLVYNVHNNFINSELLTAVSKMAHSVGAMVIVEGVEARSEVLTCMQKDLDVFQGFWFSRPQEEIDENLERDILKSIDTVGNRYKIAIQEKIRTKQELIKKYKSVVGEVSKILQNFSDEKEQKISELIDRVEKLEAIYIVSYESGKQIGDTYINAKNRFLYNPAKDGHDHSLREYFFVTKESLRGDYLSPKYLSKASGNMCRTYAAKIELDGVMYIVCCDILD